MDIVFSEFDVDLPFLPTFGKLRRERETVRSVEESYHGLAELGLYYIDAFPQMRDHGRVPLPSCQDLSRTKSLAASRSDELVLPWPIFRYNLLNCLP